MAAAVLLATKFSPCRCFQCGPHFRSYQTNTNCSPLHAADGANHHGEFSAVGVSPDLIESRHKISSISQSEKVHFLERPNATVWADFENATSVTKISSPSPVPRPVPNTSRRAWLARATGAVAVGGVALGGSVFYRGHLKETPRATTTTTTAATLPEAKSKLAPVNFTLVAKETNINITLERARTFVSLDSNTFQKKETLKLPAFTPQFLIPAPRVVKDIPNSELLVAGIVAGSAVEMVRTALLYPLQTLKTRVQSDIHTRGPQRTPHRRHLRRRIKVLRLNAIRHVREGNLYAGKCGLHSIDRSYLVFERS